MQITEMLKRENVRLADSVDSWQDAIRLAIAPLNEGGYVEDRYADEIIRATNEMGPYYVLTEDVALIHGRPEDGCIKGQLAVTVLKKPVRFSEDSFDVRLLVALAAEDSNSHIEAMQVLAGIFMDEDKIAQIVASDDADSVKQCRLVRASLCIRPHLPRGGARAPKGKEMNMVKILCCCGNGLGSSFACQMAIEQVMKKLGVQCKMDHDSVSSAAGASKGFDMIVAAENFKMQIESYNTGLPCVFLKRLVDKKEIEEKLTPVLKEMGVLE